MEEDILSYSQTVMFRGTPCVSIQISNDFVICNCGKFRGHIALNQKYLNCKSQNLKFHFIKERSKNYNENLTVFWCPLYVVARGLNGAFLYVSCASNLRKKCIEKIVFTTFKFLKKVECRNSQGGLNTLQKNKYAFKIFIF